MDAKCVVEYRACRSGQARRGTAAPFRECVHTTFLWFIQRANAKSATQN